MDEYDADDPFIDDSEQVLYFFLMMMMMRSFYEPLCIYIILSMHAPLVY